MTVVLDASAVLAFLFDEPGGDRARSAFEDAVVPATGWAEILQKVRQHGGDAAETRTVLEQLGIEVAALTAVEADVAASMWRTGTKLSLADRFCLALGQVLDVPVWTCDREWASVDNRVVVLR